MARQKKKRNKRYTGADAAQTGPVVHRYEAVERSRFGQWWYENKAKARIGGIVALVIAAIVVLISGVVGLFH